MKSLVFLFAGVLLVVVAGHHHHGPGRHGGPGCLFPKCKEFVNAVRQELKQNGCARPNCTGLQRDECMYEQLFQARMNITLEPTQECIDQVNQFLYGLAPPTSTTTSTTTTTTTTTKDPSSA